MGRVSIGIKGPDAKRRWPSTPHGANVRIGQRRSHSPSAWFSGCHRFGDDPYTRSPAVFGSAAAGLEIGEEEGGGRLYA